MSVNPSGCCPACPSRTGRRGSPRRAGSPCWGDKPALAGHGKEARQGVLAVRPTRPAGPDLHLAGPTTNGPTRDDGLDFAPWHAPQGSACGFWQGKVLAGRKPTWLLRFVGTFLLRLAERTFDA